MRTGFGLDGAGKTASFSIGVMMLSLDKMQQRPHGRI